MILGALGLLLLSEAAQAMQAREREREREKEEREREREREEKRREDALGGRRRSSRQCAHVCRARSSWLMAGRERE